MPILYILNKILMLLDFRTFFFGTFVDCGSILPGWLEIGWETRHVKPHTNSWYQRSARTHLHTATPPPWLEKPFSGFSTADRFADFLLSDFGDLKINFRNKIFNRDIWYFILVITYKKKILRCICDHSQAKQLTELESPMKF